MAVDGAGTLQIVVTGSSSDSRWSGSGPLHNTLAFVVLFLHSAEN